MHPVLQLPRSASLAATALAAAAVLAGGPCRAETRSFSSNDGRTIEATLEKIQGDQVTLLRDDGQSFTFPIQFLSAKDQEFVEQRRKEIARERVEPLNEAAGHPLFNTEPILERPAADIAKALGLRRESQTEGLLSWRLYAAFHGDPPGSYRLFGAMPYSVALYADPDGSFDNLSVVYANKGDFGSTAGIGEDHFGGSDGPSEDSLAAAMERDFEKITATLTKALGEPTRQRFGEGKSRRTVSRWDSGDASILLAMEDEEFVNLSIVSPESADSGGKTSKVDDSQIKQRIAGAVKREANGDVLISGIPMVDQGPKGYCVPATFERAMRFMGMEADMYLLAMVGQSTAGGGTSPELLIDEVKSQVYRKARRTRDDDPDKLSISRLDRFIDEGIPVMWTMYSLPLYNAVANTNTEERGEVDDWDQWAQRIAGQAEKFDDLEPTPGNHHICMIIGYNAKTGEIAVSDSWGPSYRLRWVPVAAANWAHGGRLFMIMP